MYSVWNRSASTVAVIISFAIAASARAITLPNGFTATQLFSATPLPGPTSLAFLPDGNLLITLQQGILRISQNGSVVGTPAINLAAKLCSNSERGLLGVAVDPRFAINRFVYLYYTFRKFPQATDPCPTNQPTNPDNPVNRVSRFILPPGNVIDPASEVVLVDNILSPNGNHNGGDLHFGKDGLLYVSIGDGGADYAGDSGAAGLNDAARDKHKLLGKILRIDRNGNIPSSNPFQGAQTGRCSVLGGTTIGFHCQETFAWGLRNPFRFAMDDNAQGTVRLFINDVGQNAQEEVDDGIPGADYGWNCREGTLTNNSTGPCNPTPLGMVGPIFEYSHGLTLPGAATGCNAITGGAFVPKGLWPAMDDGYLIADYGCGVIVKLADGMTGWQPTSFATALGSNSATSLTFGPPSAQQGLYFTSYAGGGQVWLIRYAAAGNTAPTAIGNAVPTTVPTSQNVAFSATGSSDPDAGDSLTYFWDFGDGTSAITAVPSTTHAYARAGAYPATLRVRDSHYAFSAVVPLPIQVMSAPPSVDIDSDGAYDAFTDGMIALRHMFGITGDGLTATALSLYAQRTAANDVESYVGNLGNSLDIDGDSKIDPLTDGVLLIRYLLGVRGSPLIVGVVAPGSPRTLEDIEGHLSLLVP